MIWIIALIIVIALMVIKKKINDKEEREKMEAREYRRKMEEKRKSRICEIRDASGESIWRQTLGFCARSG